MKSAPRARVEIYQDRRKEWRWRFVVNGRIMADSGEGYAREVGAHRAWEHFCRHITRRTFQSPLDVLAELQTTVGRLAGQVEDADRETRARGL